MPYYTGLQEFESGQIIGRATMGVLRDNDNYFWGLATRWRPWLHTPPIGGTAGQTTTTAWDGYHLLRSDATNLRYWFQVEGGATHTATATLYYHKDNGDAYEVDADTAPAGATRYVYGQTDLSDVSGITAGLHRVRLVLSHDSSDAGTVILNTPYTTYTGSQVFKVPPIIKDKATSSATAFNIWRNNDEYFNACCPNNPAFIMVNKGDPVSGSGEVIWDGRVLHNTVAEGIYYKVKFSTDDNNNRLLIFYDYGGTNEYYHVVDTPAVYEESNFDLPADTFTNRTWYRVAVVEQRTAGNPGAFCWIDYVYSGPSSRLTTTTPMADFTPGQWVYGDTTGETTALQRLSDWDNAIFPAMCYSATFGRTDWAVRIDDAVGPYNPVFKHRLKHIYDFLWYRGTGIAMEWTDGSRSLPDTDSSNPVKVIDLRSVSDLAYGQHYTLRGNVDYAAEAVYSS